MKKLLVVLAVGFVFVLTGCGGSRMRGDTTTVCTGAWSTQMAGVSNVTVTIVGDNEDIVTWTERKTMEITAYEMYWFGMAGLFLDDADIEAWFAEFSDPSFGMTWNLVSINGDSFTIEAVYHYYNLTDAQLNEIWGTDFRQVTLTAAIGGLEEAGANCNTN